MNIFEPIHKAHAIEQVQIAINFAQPLNLLAFEKIKSAMKSFESELPGYAELQGFSIAFGQIPAGAMAERHPPIGFVRSRSAPNGIVEVEMRVEPTSIVFRTSLYSRWQDVWQQYAMYLRVIIAIYAEERLPLVQVSLSYIDKFIWIGEPSTCKPSKLLRASSPYVCSHVYEKTDLWHSHTGEFQQVDDYTKRLLNINVECIDEQLIGGSRRVIGIATVLTDLLNQPAFKQFVLPNETAFDTLQERIELLHSMSKQYFQRVISDEMCDRVALSKS
jgi:uncharacterized protein (TIGR04255 family)